MHSCVSYNRSATHSNTQYVSDERFPDRANICILCTQTAPRTHPNTHFVYYERFPERIPARTLCITHAYPTTSTPSPLPHANYPIGLEDTNQTIGYVVLSRSRFFGSCRCPQSFSCRYSFSLSTVVLSMITPPAVIFASRLY